jgi:hypothetical protein
VKPSKLTFHSLFLISQKVSRWIWRQSDVNFGFIQCHNWQYLQYINQLHCHGTGQQDSAVLTACYVCLFLHFVYVCLLSKIVVWINDIYSIIYIFGYVSSTWNTAMTYWQYPDVCHITWNTAMTHGQHPDVCHSTWNTAMTYWQYPDICHSTWNNEMTYWQYPDTCHSTWNTGMTYWQYSDTCHSTWNTGMTYWQYPYACCSTWNTVMTYWQ